MDFATIGGIIAAFVFLVLSILLGSDLKAFYNMPAIMITIGGTFSALLISYPLDRYLTSLKAIFIVFKKVPLNDATVIQKVITLSNIARKDGLLALEEATDAIEDEFLKKGVLLIVDGTDPALVKTILETELTFMKRRHQAVAGFYSKIGELAPAWGMVGTLIGLIAMLKNINDPSSIGPNMSIALITILYGSLLANLFAIPFANKLKVRSENEVFLKEVMIEGLFSIQAGENPRVIEEKLKAFLAPSIRKTFFDSIDSEEIEGE